MPHTVAGLPRTAFGRCDTGLAVAIRGHGTGSAPGSGIVAWGRPATHARQARQQCRESSTEEVQSHGWPPEQVGLALA